MGKRASHKDFKEKALKIPEVRKEYESLEDSFAKIKDTIRKRKKKEIK